MQQVISIDRISNHITLSIDNVLHQVYPAYNSTFTIKYFPEELSGNKPQVKIYMHILGINPAYQSHVGFDIYLREGGTTSQLLVSGVDCTDDLESFINEMTAVLS